MSLEILPKNEQRKAEKFGISEEVANLIRNCECGENNNGRIIILDNLRRWELMEVVGNYLDPMGETVPDWSDIKRLATFCKAFEIENSEELTELYALAVCEGGESIAYTVADGIVLEIWEDVDRIAPTEATETTETEGESDPLAVALQVSQSRKSSKYNCTKAELKNGYYFEYNGLKVPFRVLLSENSKTEGIYGIAFGTAKDCPSRSLGLCQLPSDSLCYARAGERRATRKDNEDGSKGMDSYYNGLLCSEFWDEFETDQAGALRLKFMEHLDSIGADTLRFNLKGDFRHSLDCVAIHHLAGCGFKLTGYTARDDLEECEILGKNENIILNGSNRKYTNRFRATDSIAEYLGAKYPCLGSCSTCRKCYSLRGVEITVLIHGKGSETALNNPENREWVTNHCRNKAGASFFEAKDFERGKELITCINKTFEALGFPRSACQFKSTKEFIQTFKKGGK